MHIKHNPLRFICRAAAIVIFAAAATHGLQAQQASGAEGGHPASFAALMNSSATLLAANDAPDTIGYSSSAGAEETASAESYMSSSLAADPSPQPPPRYGRRPVYADSSHNADGSSKYTFFGGAGFTLPTGGTHSYFSPNYNLQVGAGRNFNKKFAALIEFDYANFGLQKSLTDALGSSTGIFDIH